MISEAQMRLLDRIVPGQRYMAENGVEMGSTPETFERRSFKALVRKKLLRSDGQITQAGLIKYDRKVKRIKKREAT